MKNKEKNIESYIAWFAMFLAIANIFVVLLKAPEIFWRPFSLGLSVFIFYFGWEKFKETETYQKIKMLFFLHHLEKMAFDKAKEVIENAEQESKG